MIVFAVDSSSAAGSAAVLKDGIIYEAYANEGLTHSETLLVRCDEVFKESGITPEQVDCFAVTSGPGSFTGLRIGMGLIKGLAFTGNKPCVPVPTFEALVEGENIENGDLLAVLDARQKRVYYAAFRVKSGEIIRLCEDRLAPIAELNDACKVLGLESPLIVGDVSEDVCGAIADARVCAEEEKYVRAGNVAKAALRLFEQGRTVSCEELAPFYLQPSQAERNRNAI